MRRKAAKAGITSTHTRESRQEIDATRRLCGLEDRVAELERVVAQLMRESELANDLLPGPEPVRPGPKPKHSSLLLHDRDAILQMLESYWPEIEPHCCPKPTPDLLKGVLTAIRKRAFDRHRLPASELLKHFQELVTFLSSGRFRSDPRQIANAMAGFPAIGFWRSLKLCQASPSALPIGERAIRAYIRRKHRELFGNLEAELSVSNFADALTSYKSKDPHLAPYGAEYLLQSWHKCKLNYAQIRVPRLPSDMPR
jgi:hypothetical protein